MAAEAGGILDTRNPISILNFQGIDANWESWRVIVEAYAALTNMGSRRGVAAEQTSFTTHEGLDAGSVTVGGAVHAFTKCEGKALSLVSLVPRRLDWKRGESSRKSMRVKVEVGQQRS